jgi:hypothetical protein
MSPWAGLCGYCRAQLPHHPSNERTLLDDTFVPFLILFLIASVLVQSAVTENLRLSDLNNRNVFLTVLDWDI